MMATFAEFHFLRPLWLLLLLAIPLFWLLRHRGRADAGAWRGAIDPHLLPHLIERIDAGSGRGGIVLAIALWTLAAFALAGPAWEREPMPLYRNQAARVLALELSSTMMALDEKPSRFERARYKLVDILERSKDYQTALIGYAGEAYVAAPLTDDIGTVRNLVDALDPSTMPVAGNRRGRARSSEAQQLIQQAGLQRGDIILLADSADQSGDRSRAQGPRAGLAVSVLGVGSTAGAPVALAQGDFLKDDSGNVIVAGRDDASLARRRRGRRRPLRDVDRRRARHRFAARRSHGRAGESVRCDSHRRSRRKARAGATAARGSCCCSCRLHRSHSGAAG